jgi:hypothetical protein
MTVLAVANDLARHRRLATQRAAQLTHDAASTLVVKVYVLSGQRRAPAVDAAVAVSLQGTHATPQQEALELLCVVGRRRGHLLAFRRAGEPSCRPGALASRWHRPGAARGLPANGAG